MSVAAEVPGGLAAILENLCEAVIVIDLLGNVVLRNRANRELLCPGFRPVQNVFKDRDVTLWYPDGTQVPEEDYPVRRLLRGLPVVEQEYLHERKDGRLLWVVANGTTIVSGGVPQLAIVTHRDVTLIHKIQETRDDYLRAVSHDLKSPLNIISVQGQMLMELLQNSSMAGEERRAYDIVRNASRMNLMIDDLAESLRLEASGFQLHTDSTDIGALVKDVVDRMAVLGGSRVVISVPGEPVILHADALRLERCIQNLVGNALRYSPPSSAVEIRVKSVGAFVRIEVCDSGPGISEDELPFIFERFYRGKAGAGLQGLGLGLYVSRLIAEAHGGSISVKSASGEGSVFTLSIPRGQGS